MKNLVVSSFIRNIALNVHHMLRSRTVWNDRHFSKWGRLEIEFFLISQPTGLPGNETFWPTTSSSFALSTVSESCSVKVFGFSRKHKSIGTFWIQKVQDYTKNWCLVSYISILLAFEALFPNSSGFLRRIEYLVRLGRKQLNRLMDENVSAVSSIQVT